MSSVLEKELNVIKDLYKSCEKEASEVVLFGSVVEGSWNEKSDIDVLFVAKKDKSTELDKSIRKACASRNLRIGVDVCIENLHNYTTPFHRRRHKFHFLKATKDQLKSGEMVKESMLSDNRLRCLLQLKRENFALSGYVIEDGRIIWGTLGYYWAVYYRFYSYKQYLFYKSDRPTYFNWKTKQTQIGGNNNYWYLNYYNANPYTERSTQQASIIHYHIYETSLTASGISPTISAVQVSDFWSDYMSSFHGSLIYQ